jgi:hypothetical protein
MTTPYRLVHHRWCDFADQIVGTEDPAASVSARDPGADRDGYCSCGANPALAAAPRPPDPLQVLVRTWEAREFPDQPYAHTALERAVQQCAQELRAVLMDRLNLKATE